MKIYNYYNKIKIHYKNGTLLERILEKVFLKIIPIFYFFNIHKLIKIDNNKILIMTTQNDYTCNPKYIVEEILKRKKHYKIIWAVKNISMVSSNYPKEVKLVRRKSIKFYKNVFSSKVWIDNAHDFFNEGLPKRKEQIFINTWHGSMGLKRIGEGDIKDKAWVKKAERCKKETDYSITNSKFEEMVFRKTYWPNNIYWKYGHPRNDIFFKTENEIKNIKIKIYNKYKISSDVRIVLYAPTFRADLECDNYDIDFELLISALSKRFGGKWIVMIRMHNNIKKNKKARLICYGKNIVDATDYPDMQELLVVADVGITDYSSWICDYVLTKKPAFLYAKDIEDYNEERGFYYPLKDTPFLVAQNNEILNKNILSFQESVYKDKCDLFLKDRGCYENGLATIKVVNEIEKIMG